jgi:hypothetical protein
MKQFFVVLSTVFLLQILLVAVVFSQNQSKDVVYLKNGSVIKGDIIEQIPNKSIKIQTSDGNIFVYDFSDIEKIAKESGLTSSNRQSAVSAPSTTSFGIKAGLNFANMGGDNSSGNSSTTLFGVGGFVAFNIQEKFNIQGELLYNQKGFKMSGTTYGYAYTATQTFSYLDINVLAKYNIQVEGNIEPFIFAGPNLGILLSSNSHIEVAGNSSDNDIKSSMSGADFGLIIGAGISFKVGTGAILFDVRYDLGLANINATSTVSNTNQVFSITAGYEFGK